MINYLSSPAEYSMADEWYEFATEDHFWMKWRFNVLQSIVPKGYSWGEVLDIGCGNGIPRKQIERYYNCNVSGCDLNEHMLSQVSEGRGQVYFYNIHQREEKFRDYFETILLLDVLEHIKEPVAFLDSVSFHLRPNGKIIINLPAFQSLYSKYDRTVGHIKRYTIPLLRRELEQSGLILEDVMYWGASLVPLLLIRKFIMLFCKDKQVTKCGFQPPSSGINSLLLLFMKLERIVAARPFIGTSLLALASKKR
jgi:SAM-dependent methyltransferase